MRGLRGDWKQLAKRAIDQGWRVEATGKLHYKWLSPDLKTIVVSAGSPSDQRAIKNQLARMRRGGFRD